MENRWIGARFVIVASDFAGDEIDDDGLPQGGVRVFLEIRIGEERDFRRGGVKFKQVEFRADLKAFAKLGRGDAEKRRNARVIAGIDEIHRARKSLAVGQGVDCGAELSGIYGSQIACKRLARSMRDVGETRGSAVDGRLMNDVC